MFCKRALYVNWGNIPHLEFEFGPVNLFSGGNGSGKTTAADGLQSLMTAAYENLFTFNPGQDETTQRGRGGKQVRTLSSYILGCDDGSYARLRTSDGYVAATFHPTSGENGELFSALMGVRARLDSASKPRQARQQELVFLILPEVELRLSDLVKEDKGGKYVVAVDAVANQLKMKYGKNRVEVYDKKSPYLRRLYGALRGLNKAVSDREAKHAARTFSNFMAYKPVKSINEFVANEVLEPKDLSEDIKQVSELMKTIHGMEAETRHLQEAIDNLDLALHSSKNYIDAWLEHSVGNYCEASRQLLEKQNDYLKHKKLEQETQTEIHDVQQGITQNKDKKLAVQDELIELHARRQGIEALKTKDQLETEIDSLKDNLVSCVGPLLQQDQLFNKNFQASKNIQGLLKQNSLAAEIPDLDSKDFRTALNAVVSGAEETGLDAHRLLNKDWMGGVEELENKLQTVVELENIHARLWWLIYNKDATRNELNLRDQILSCVEKYREKCKRSQHQIQTKQHEIKQLQNKKVSYPEHTELALRAIGQQCPQAKPCVLCDYVEITDPVWQMAIEGYLGGTRFSIIVEEAYEAQAISIVRSLAGKRNNARVIQGSKAKRDVKNYSAPTKGSILEVLSFEHKTVEYYISVSYGSVLRVDNAETLKQTARGVTAEGLGSGNYSMFRCDLDEENLVFGQGARERALAAKEKQLLQLQEQDQQLQNNYQTWLRLQELCTQIHNIECGEYIRHMLQAQRQLQKAEKQLEDLDLSDFTEIEERLTLLRNELVQLDGKSSELSEQLGRLSSNQERLSKTIDKIATEQEELQIRQEQSEQAVVSISNIYPEFVAEAALEAADERARLAGNAFSFSDDNHTLLDKADKAERELYGYVIQHNQTSNTYNNIVYFTGTGDKHDLQFFKHIVKLRETIGSTYNSLKNNVLVGRLEKLISLKESFNTAFVTNLCHSIYQAINYGERTLKELNKELEHHRFGADQERFYFAFNWVPEFKEYRDFFKEVIDIPNLGDGSTLFEIQLSANSTIVRDRLMGMLLNKDEIQAQQELKRISDYRNFRSYEIFKEPLNKEPIALSTYGTGSGGQLETPAYIIRSAAVTSAFRFNEGQTHCRMVLVDEAFSKMDETRSREVINYLTNTLGLQLIFIMPTSKSGPFMDLISHQIVFSKCPTESKIGELNTRVLVDRKVCNQDKIKALWAQHRKTIRQQTMLDFMEEI